MRCENIQVHGKIPVQANSVGNGICSLPCFRDCNGVVFQTDAIKDACEEAENLPIIRYKDDGTSEAIGVAHSVKWNPDGYVEFDGVIWFGGASEEIIFDSVGDVASMTIEAIGFSNP